MFSSASHPPNVYSQEDLPKQVVCTLNQGSSVMRLDFHPVQQTILLGTFFKHFAWFLNFYFVSAYYVFNVCCKTVGTNVGDIGIWEVGSRERIAHKTFKVWDIGSCTLPLQVII